MLKAECIVKVHNVIEDTGYYGIRQLSTTFQYESEAPSSIARRRPAGRGVLSLQSPSISPLALKPTTILFSFMPSQLSRTPVSGSFYEMAYLGNSLSEQYGHSL